MKTSTNKTLVIWVAGGMILLLLTYIPMFMSPAIVDAFTREDRIYESLSALWLFATAACFFIAFIRSKVAINIRDPYWIRRMVFLGFAIMFFLAGGEEISWGQRIFGFDAPNLVKEHNIQKEFTMHNLDFIQGENAIIPFSFGQLAAMFALTFGAFIPLASRYIRPLGSWLEKVFPVLPVASSVLLIGNYLIQKIIVRTIPVFPQLYHNPDLGFRAALLETREHGYELALLIATILYVFVKLRSPAAESHASQTAARPEKPEPAL